VPRTIRRRARCRHRAAPPGRLASVLDQRPHQRSKLDGDQPKRTTPGAMHRGHSARRDNGRRGASNTPANPAACVLVGLNMPMSRVSGCDCLCHIDRPVRRDT
jgi:hypothetical protein